MSNILPGLDTLKQDLNKVNLDDYKTSKTIIDRLEEEIKIKDITSSKMTKEEKDIKKQEKKELKADLKNEKTRLKKIIKDNIDKIPKDEIDKLQKITDNLKINMNFKEMNLKDFKEQGSIVQNLYKLNAKKQASLAYQGLIVIAGDLSKNSVTFKNLPLMYEERKDLIISSLEQAIINGDGSFNRILQLLNPTYMLCFTLAMPLLLCFMDKKKKASTEELSLKPSTMQKDIIGK